MIAIKLVSGTEVRVVAVPPAPGAIIVGSAAGCDLVVEDPSVDPQHLLVEGAPGGARITDQGTSRGTKLNGLFVSRGLARPGDEILIGGSVLRLVDEEVAAAPIPIAPAAPVRTTAPSRRERPATAHPAAAPSRAPAAQAPRSGGRAAPRPVRWWIPLAVGVAVAIVLRWLHGPLFC